MELLTTIAGTTHELVKLMSAEHPTCNGKATGSKPVTSSKTVAIYSQPANLGNNPGVTADAGVMVGRASFEAFRPHQRNL